MSNDPVIAHQRAQIAALDLQLLATLNARIDLVTQLKEYKVAQGLSFHDAAQEERVLASLRQANQGPLPAEGVEELFRLILAWSKRTAE